MRFLSLLLAFVFFSCSGDSSNNETAYIPEVYEEYDRDLSSLVSSTDETFQKELNSYSTNIFNEVVTEKGETNFMFSPFSAAVALAMAANGAGGETLNSMLDVLGFGGLSLADMNGYLSSVTSFLSGEDSSFQAANSIWCREDFTPLKRSFYEIVTDYYLADIYLLQSYELINSWVNDKTHGKIPELVKKDIEGSTMALVNAIYFKGDWASQFEEDNTSSKSFTTPAGEVLVDMMNQSTGFKYKKGENYQAVRLAYKAAENGQAPGFSMYVYLPDETSSLSDFYSLMNDGETGHYVPEFDYEAEEWKFSWEDKETDIFSDFSSEIVKLHLPKFKCETKIELKDILINMGMESAFDPDIADFTNFSDGKNLCIVRVFQKTFIEVNETGTEAAAATVIEGDDCDAPEEIPPLVVDVNVNRPFFYCIRENKTGTTLFMGQVLNPNE